MADLQNSLASSAIRGRESESMFWKLLGSFGTLLLLVLIAFLTVVQLEMARGAAQATEADVRRTAALLAGGDDLLAVDPALLAERLRRTASLCGAQLYVFDGDGRLRAGSIEGRRMPASPLEQAAVASLAPSTPTLQWNSSTGELGAFQLLPSENSRRGYLQIIQSESAVWRTWRRNLWILSCIGAPVAIGLCIVLAATFDERYVGRIRHLRDSLRTARRAKLAASQDDGGQIGLLAESMQKLQRRLYEHNARLERANNDLRAMLATIPEGVVALDADQCILFANPSVYQMFGVSPRHRPGQKLWELIRHPSLQEAVGAAFASHEPYSTEFELLSPPRILAFRGRTLAVESGRAIIVLLHDMTELRRLERVRQEFFSNISHELKTPLSAIKAFAETLLNGFADGDQDVERRFLKRIDEQTDRLHALVLDMLMLARVESKEPGFVLQWVDARDVVQTSVESFRPDAEIKGVRLRVELSPSECRVQVDPEGLQIILRNLVDNAIKYTSAGGEVAVSVEPEAAHVALSVTDTGMGIPAADQGRVFERFYRVDKARSRELGGTGLGLSIVKHLTQTFGGSVGVTSQLGEGSAFVIRLPSAGAGENVDEAALSAAAI